MFFSSLSCMIKLESSLVIVILALNYYMKSTNSENKWKCATNSKCSHKDTFNISDDYKSALKFQYTLYPINLQSDVEISLDMQNIRN